MTGTLPLGMLMQPYGQGRENLLRVRVSEREQRAINDLRLALRVDNASDVVRMGLTILDLAQTEAPDLVDAVRAMLRLTGDKE